MGQALKCDHSNESYLAVLSFRAHNCPARSGSTFKVKRALWLADTRHPYTRGLHADMSLLSAWLLARLIPSRFMEVF